MRFVVCLLGLLARPRLCQLMGFLKWWCLVRPWGDHYAWTLVHGQCL